MTKTFLVHPDGSVSVSKDEPGTVASAPRYQEILAKLKDANSSPEEVLRTLCAEVATLIKNMEECGSDPFREAEHKQCLLQINGLLAATTYTKRAWRDQRDQLNFDGPKFQFAFNAITEMMQQAALEALGKRGTPLSKKIVNNFQRLLKAKEPDLRRRVQEIGSPTGTKASYASVSGNSGSVIEKE
ncbi:MAG: hypothetical protein WCE53_05665 [Candidatus Acidiferrum sp.]